MRALVLSGGGRNGAFQVGVIRHLLWDAGMHYEILCGVSAGAVNAAFLAQYGHGQEDLAVHNLMEVWRAVKGRHSVYRPWSLICGASPLLSLLSGKPSLYDATPFHELIKKHIELPALRKSGKKLRIGAVRADTRAYRTWSETDSLIHHAIAASSSFPGVFQPVRVGEHPYIDGVVRQTTPLNDAIDLGATDIDVVLCNKLYGPGTRQRKFTIVGLLQAAAAASAAEFESWDLKVTGLYNRLVSGGVITTHRHVNVRVIRPLMELGDPLNFDPAEIAHIMRMGYETARDPNAWLRLDA